MVQGCDYGAQRPDPACLFREHGIRFVVRYTSIGPNSKNMSPAEVRQLLDAGLALVTVFEQKEGHMLLGRAAGVEAAKASRDLAAACGMPSGRPHYFALDTDPNPLHDSDWDRIKEYLDGAASVLGRSAVGVYGGFLAIEKLVPTWAPWGWQARAWSGGRWSAKAHLQQYRNEVQLCGSAVDLDRTHPDRSIADYGQWGLEEDLSVMDEATKQYLDNQFKAVDHHLELIRVGDNPDPPHGRTHPNNLATLLQRIDDIETALGDIKRHLGI